MVERLVLKPLRSGPSHVSRLGTGGSTAPASFRLSVPGGRKHSREPCRPMTPRVLLFAYSEVGAEALALLLARDVTVAGLVTHAADPDENIWFRPPAALAHERGLPVFTPEDVNDPAWIERLRSLQPDLILSAYYRNLLPPRLLEAARLGAFNLHGSLLPRYRGRAPVNWALLHGETRLGLTLHRMVARADAGPIVDQAAVEVGPRATAAEAYAALVPLVRELLGRQLDALLAGTARETPQDESRATTFRRRTAEDGRIDWTQPSARIFNLIRAVTAPYPGAFTDGPGARLLVWWAEPDTPHTRGRRGAPGEVLAVAPLVVATGDGALELTRVAWRGQPAAPPAVGQRW